MVLSNAERQARFRKRIVNAAKSGVTPADVRRVAELLYAQSVDSDPSLRSWNEFVALTRTRKGRVHWLELLDNSPEHIEDGDYGDDTDLVRRVLAVVTAATTPPPLTSRVDSE